MRLFAVLAVLSGSPAFAVQCAEGNAPTVDDLLKAEEAMANAKSTIARIAAFKTLLTARDPDFLTESIQLGLKSDNKAIRATALRCKLLNSSYFTIQTLPYEQAAAIMPDMDDKTSALAKAGKEWRLSVAGAIEEESCVSLYKEITCDPQYAAVASALSVALRRDHQVGRFELSDEGRLMGTFIESTWHNTPIVPAELFMD